MAQTVTFLSNFTRHQIVRQPANDRPVPSGIGWISETPGVRYQFEPAVDDETGKMVGRLDVRVGQDKMIDTRGWLHPDADPEKTRDAVEALRAHREFGRDFWQMSTPAKAVRAEIRRALANLDEEALTAVIDGERAVNARADLISEAEDALALVREQIASLQARAEQEQAEAEAAAAKKAAKAKPKAPAA